ncbi:hypothetical protein ORI89_07485, partial [Sphingobacterium sp. UT-1RO-CII-1]|uniref:hypothetical protein n=1 Tax=Sphingobacterium sp. UT-1RO-CII-1 TaxID=2995225 RepID=UPI00227BC34B
MYREIYFHDYCINDTGDNARLSIRKKNYGGASTSVDAGPIPFKKSILNSEENLIGGIYPTMGEIQLIGTNTFGMDDLITANDSDYQVVHLVNGEVDWIGFLTPESFGEVDTNNLRYLDINAFDGLTRLKDLKFVDSANQNFGATDGSFEKSLLFYIKECLKKTGLELDIVTLVDRLPVVPTGEFKDAMAVIPIGDEWIYSQSFNSLSTSLVKVGNYFTWTFEDDAKGSVFTSEILEVDRSDVDAGGGVGIRLSPAPLTSDVGDLNREISYLFFEATSNRNQDVLSVSKIDARIWVDPTGKPDEETKKKYNYWDFTKGTRSAWDVLNDLALSFDFIVSQNYGQWIISAVDIHRIEDDFFRYDYNGSFIDRVPQSNVVVIPCEIDKIFNRKDGNTRYIDKTLKSVSVGYEYRFKAEGDDLANFLQNGNFLFPTLVNNPNTYTPDFWERKAASALTIAKKVLPPYPPLADQLIMTGGSNQKFKWNNGLMQKGMNLEKDDTLYINLWHDFTQHWYDAATYANAAQYVAFEIKLINKNNSSEVYYLVNKGVEGDISFNGGVMHLPSDQTGQWVKKPLDSNIAYYYKSNTIKKPISSEYGSWVGWSEINIKSDNVPVDGFLVFTVIGSATETTWYSKKEGRASDYNFYALDVDIWNSEANVVFNEELPNPDIRLQKYTSFENQFADSGGNPDLNFYPSIAIADIKLSRISGQTKGIGRLYEYRQIEDYFDTLDDITIVVGDEDNEDHLSVVKVEGVVCDKWLTRSGGMQLGALGLTLARSIQRRYFTPKRMLDGEISAYPLSLHNIYDFEDYAGLKWGLKSGDVSLKDHSFNGTFVQLQSVNLPNGGFDFGPNSLTKINSSSNSSGSSSGGGGSSGGTSIYAEKAGYAERAGRADIATHAATADTAGHANTADLATHSLTANHANTSDLAKRALRADLADNSILWNGLAQPNYLTQPVRPGDSPKFEGVSSPAFQSGWSGNGYRIVKDANGKYVLEVDDLFVRGEANFYSLVVNELKSTNGAIIVSDGIEITGVTKTGSNYVCSFDTDDGAVGNPFRFDDVVKCQVWNGQGAKLFVGRVLSTTSSSFTLSILQGSSIPSEGDHIVRIDNFTDNNRKGIVYITASDSGAPFIDTVYGMWTDRANSVRTRMGNLAGIVSPIFGTLADFGFYGKRAYLEEAHVHGTLIATSGSNVYNKSETQAEISNAEGRINLQVTNKIDAIQIGGQNIANSGGGGNNWKNSFFYSTDYNMLTNVTIGGKIWKRKNIEGQTLRIQQTLGLISDEYYTWSFDAFTESGIDNINFRNYAGGSNYTSNSIDITTTPTRYYVTFKVRSGYTSDLPHIYGIDLGTHFADFQLEKGNKGTEWKPSVHDIKDSINAVQSSVTNLAITVDANTQSISQKAERTEVNALGNRVSTAEQKITPDAINFTVKAQVDSKSTGRMIYRDPSFESGLNSVKVYN